MNRKIFADKIRKSLFAPRISQSQWDGVETMLNEWDRRRLKDLRHLAYMLATAYHEVGATMQPVREGFKKSDADARAHVQRQGYRYAKVVNGHVYYGRGLVQLTHHDNYVRMGKLLKLPLAENPDLALRTDVAVQILFEGMLRAESFRGDFTGKALEDYFNAGKDDPVNARRIVNGTDRAAMIAGYHAKFLSALSAAA